MAHLTNHTTAHTTAVRDLTTTFVHMVAENHNSRTPQPHLLTFFPNGRPTQEMAGDDARTDHHTQGCCVTTTSDVARELTAGCCDFETVLQNVMKNSSGRNRRRARRGGEHW